MTRTVKYLLFGFLGLFAAIGCSTEDVDFITGETTTSNQYALSDVAFAEYLMYNASLPASNETALPFGICISRNDTFFLDTEKAAKVRNVYLVKTAKQIEALKTAGVASAEVKIANIDGIRYFSNCSNLKLTSNGILGTLDLSSLTRLDTLEMNANLVNTLVLPASITRLRYSASSTASEDQRLSAIDLSHASSLQHLYLTNHRITSEGLQLPVSYKKLTEIDLSGNTGAPFGIPQALYDQLTERKGVEVSTDNPTPSNQYALSDVAFAEYLMYNASLPATDETALPFGICISRNDTFFLDTEKAANVRNVYLVKTAKQIEALKIAGVASADVKIANIDGIRYFSNCSNLKLTSNGILGTLDLSSLTRLDTLEMNANLVNTLVLPASITRLRYSASSTASEDQRLSAIDLSHASSLQHLYLTNHRITSEGLQLPVSYKKLTEIDLSGNTGAPFGIPQALYDQLTERKGVEVSVPEIPDPAGYAVKDIAFAEYLLYLTETEPSDSYRLPAGTVYREGDVIYLNTTIAGTFNGTLNISKASSFITTLENAGVASAKTKIADADGLQHFTSLKRLVATSNAFTAELPLESLTQLDSLVVRTAGVAAIDLSKNTALRYLDIQGSASKSLNRMQAADLSKNINLYYVNLSANEIDPSQFSLPVSWSFLRTLNLGGNKVNATAVTFMVPAALYDQLGSDANDKAGLIRGE